MTDISDQTKWRKVFQSLATDLKAEVALAALSEIIVKQSTAANLRALVTLAGLQGIIPEPITATRINKGSEAIDATTAKIYTVPADTVLFIFAISIDITCVANAGVGRILVKNAAGVEQYKLFHIRLVATSTREHAERYLCPAVKASAGWYIEIFSEAVGMRVWGELNGWLEAV